MGGRPRGEASEERQLAAAVHRLRRLGARHVEVTRLPGGQVQVEAKMQTGRSHVPLRSEVHGSLPDALGDVAEQVRSLADRPSRRQPIARPLQRPDAGLPRGPIDDVPLAEQPERLAELPPFRHRREQADRAEREARRRDAKTVRGHVVDRGTALPAADRRDEPKPGKPDRGKP